MAIAVSELTWLCWFLSSGIVAELVFTNLEGLPGEGYYIGIGIGSPPQNFNVLVDTGSATLAIAAAPLQNVNTYFQNNRSESFISQGKEVCVKYTQGSWQGDLGSDLVTIPNIGVPQIRSDLGLIKTAHDFFTKNPKWQGILGLAYPELSQSHGAAHSWFSALPGPPAFNLTLCGQQTKSNTLQGTFHILPSHQHSVSPFTATVLHRLFYKVAISNIWVNNKPVNMPCKEFNNAKSIVDSGTTNLRFPRKVFHEVVEMMSSEVQNKLNLSSGFWKAEKLLCFETVMPLTQFPKLKIGLVRVDRQFFTVEIGPQSYLQYVKMTNGSLNHCYQYAVEPSESGSVLGLVFLEGLVAIFDQTNQSVSFNKANCGPSVHLEGPFIGKSDLLYCGYWERNEINNIFMILAIIVAVLLSISVAVLLYLYIWPSNHPFRSIWFLRSTNHVQLLPTERETELNSTH